jgi:membrane associated rhomboid family serine protease
MPRTRRRRPAWFQVQTMAARLAIALIIGSAVWFLTRSDWLLLVPGRVLERAALWQLGTYAFVASDPFGVIFAALVIWSVGVSLEASWGSRRLLEVVLGSTVLAGVLTVLTAIPVTSVRGLEFAGAWVMATAMWVLYGLSHGKRQINFWGMPITGNVFALIGIGFVLLRALFMRDVRPVLPELFGVAVAIGYFRLGSPRLWWLRIQSWRFQRQLKARSKHLRVIAKDRNTSRDSDRYLH